MHAITEGRGIPPAQHQSPEIQKAQHQSPGIQSIPYLAPITRNSTGPEPNTKNWEEKAPRKLFDWEWWILLCVELLVGKNVDLVMCSVDQITKNMKVNSPENREHGIK